MGTLDKTIETPRTEVVKIYKQGYNILINPREK